MTIITNQPDNRGFDITYKGVTSNEPAIFTVSVQIVNKESTITLTSTNPNYPKIFSDVFSSWKINGVVYTSVGEAVDALRAFTNFKPSGGSGQETQNHSELNQLSYGASGHTGFASGTELTSHMNDLTIHKTPLEQGKIDNLPIDTNTEILQISNNITNHSGDTTKHLTNGERATWNSKEPSIGPKNSAFNVDFETSIANIKANGIASLGTLNTVAKSDHIHPRDPEKLSLSGGTLTGDLNSPVVRIGGPQTNKIHGIGFSSPGTRTWVEYMSPPATDPFGQGVGILGDLMPSAGVAVTSWARRSYISNASGYGWIWEAGPESSGGDTNPKVIAELNSQWGTFRTIGSITGSGMYKIGSSDSFLLNGGGGHTPFEEGIWTPTIYGATTAGVPTYTTQVGRYQRVGNQVFFSLYLVGTFNPKPSGYVRISGLPIASSVYGSLPGGGFISAGYTNYQLSYHLGGANMLGLGIYQSGIETTLASAVFGTHMNDSKFMLHFSGSYFIS